MKYRPLLKNLPAVDHDFFDREHLARMRHWKREIALAYQDGVDLSQGQ